jgi:hypothetical protein
MQIEADVANWTIQTRRNDLWNEPAYAIWPIVILGGDTSASINNI